MRARLVAVALDHPRHLGLAAVVAGLALARASPTIVAALAAVVALAALGVPLVRHPVAALALAAAVSSAAVVGQARIAALERTALTPLLGHAVSGEATVLSAARRDRFGGRRAVVRWPVPASEGGRVSGERVLLRISGTRVRFEIGEIVRVRGTLRTVDRAGRAVGAHATLRAELVEATGRRRGGAAGAVDAVRRRAEAALARGLAGEQAGLFRGMVLGQDAAMPDDLRDAFRAAGLSHLVAASGANVMLLAVLALAVGALAGLGLRARWWLVLGLIALYVPLAGAGPSIQRAGVMGAAGIVALLAGRPASRWYGLGLAAALTLALDPRALSDPGWQLSFASVLAILLLAGRLRRRLAARGLPGLAAEAVAVTLAATLATAPLIAAHFDRVSLVSLPANVLAVIAVAPVMWLGIAAAAVGQLAPVLATPFVALAVLPLSYLGWLAHTAAALPGAQAELPVPAVGALCAAAIVALVGRDMDRAATVRRAMVVALLATAALFVIGTRERPPAAPPRGTLRMTFLDVGQGDATLLQSDGAAVLVDTGPPGGPVVERLRQAGAGRLDLLLVTHASVDHAGGAPQVLRALPVGALLDGRDGDRGPASIRLDTAVAGAGLRVVRAVAGQEVRVGPITLRILWPPRDPPLGGPDPNDRAVVAEATAHGARVLLTADAESDVLARLELRPSAVLKVAHHGSADPGLAAVLRRVQPRLAVIPVGSANPYGHPAPATLRALRAVTDVRRTDLDGTVRVDAAGGALTTTGGH